MQHEITKSDLLLDEKGNLREPGYAKTLLPIYNRKQIKAGPLRIKEWDYYLVTNDHFAVALTIADNSYMGLDSISFLNYDKGFQKTVSPMQFLTKGKKNLPQVSHTGNLKSHGKNYRISFKHESGKRVLDFYMEKFLDGQPISGHLVLNKEPKESMVIATPFDKPGYFYYNQKINCMKADGWVKIGKDAYFFTKQDSYGVLDWGRGAWTYKNTWYWSSASGQVDGVSFGFNLGYGFGNTENATENMIFYNGKAHKLNQVEFIIPRKENVPEGRAGYEDYWKPWKFTSDDGRFEMVFQPILDRASRTNLLFLESDQHQVFGKFTGKAVLDDGKIIEVRDFLGFAEKVKNKW